MEKVVRIEKVVFGGEGLGRLPDGKVLFVPYSLPGELVKVKIVKDFGDYAEADLIDLLEPSPERRDPLCPYYGVCGGCQFQHAVYQAQLNLKKTILYETFARAGWKEEVPLEGVVPSPKEFFYRNRLRLHVEAESLKMGFVKRKSHEVLRIERCLLAEEVLNQVLLSLYQTPSWLRLSTYSKRIKIESSPLDGKATLIFWTAFRPNKQDLEELSSLPQLKASFYWMKGRHPEGPFPEDASFGGRRLFQGPEQLVYYVQPGVFVQTNWGINLAIIETIKSWGLDCETVLDLHCGMGNFVLALLSEGITKALGVDTDLRAIEDGLYTAERNGINGRLDLRQMSSTEALYQAIKQGEEFDLMVLDPPRGGCKEILRFLPEVNRKYLVYVSCDAPTLARDLKILKDLGYVLKKVYLFDMFPQTYHFEVLSLLEKKA
ncbi:23S rRNA (uracil(1939)-C(5))-methyltransferase RlmD [Thermodesulfobacterium sp. TA1]|uniref:23S rRNA (uracil(1939)-C(5))-methyltransferase RlmD n=1 Tax=Thermodesulfobacterium sp. TA1 TaxID=2234087 RepID=UPI001231AEC5|nr:23S rRNA (uracil(1939)-C(5))-methyltransferase RlmD [Thermodesulfobacterium sp. TA1]QER42459.1 23S rRNA (uracil(1939)-C(5))-methyltransferase RlmD [Thermodesulfobacterium sp. TA1]